MTMKEVIDAMLLFPPLFKDVALVALILSLIQISPLKLNPWEWLKSFISLPKRIEKLENEFNDDRAFRWRSMIISRGNRVQDGFKMRKEVWKDTIETIDNYEKYCNQHPNFRNELASMTIAYMRHKYMEACENNDFLQEER